MNTYIGVLQKYAVFSGRATRSEFWLFTLINSIVISTLGGLLFVEFLFSLFSLFYLAFGLAILIPSIAVLVRRLHDTGRSGWWYFLTLIPLIGPIILIIFLVGRSDLDNEYGLVPDSQPGA